MDIILYLLIGLWCVWIDDKHGAIGSSVVHINGNITAEVNSNDIRLECSFTLEKGDDFYSTALTAENGKTDNFIEIAGYLRDTNPLFTSFGMVLFGNETTSIHFDETQNMLTFEFDNVTCRHERRYKCFLLVTSSTSVILRSFKSDAIWIFVTAKKTTSDVRSDNKKDQIIVIISSVVAFVTAILFLIVVCICKKRQTSSSKFFEYGIKMTNTKKTNNENKETDYKVEHQQKNKNLYIYWKIWQKKDPNSKNTYAVAFDEVYDKAGDRRHIEENNCEPFDHVDTAKNVRKNKKTDNDTYRKDAQQDEDTYADAPDGVYDKSGDRRHIEEKDCELFDHADTANNNSTESNKPTDRTDSTIMFNRNPKRHDQSKSSGYESVDMEGETPFLLSTSNGNGHADADLIKQHNEKYLQNDKEEDGKVNKTPGSHQHVEYAQVDETKKLKNKNKQTDTEQETVEIHAETKFESDEMHEKPDENDYSDEPMIKNNENSDEETESIVASDHIMGRVNPTFENDDVSSKDETIKVAMVSPMIRMAEPPIEHKQIDTTKAESKDRVNLCQTVDDNDDDFHATRHSTSLARSGDPKEEDNRNAETQQGIHERSDRTVDNAEYFDTASHLESVASYEDTKQKENKNAAARLEINERSGRTVDNAGYFDTTTHLEKEHNHNDPETAIKNYQTKSYTNQAFDGEYNQEEDAVSFPVRLLDRVQVDEQNNQNDDKQSKHDYENVGSTAQPKSSNGDTIH